MVAFAVASALLVLALVVSLRPPTLGTLRHPATLAAVALFVGAMIVRAVAVQPTLVHADVVAPELVDCVLDAPRVCTTRGASYGQYGFLLLGAITRPLGHDLDAVFRANEIVGGLNVALLALLAYRLSGSPWGALFAVAVSGTNPVFMRVAASEDMHNVGLLLSLLAVVAMDVFAVRRRSAALVAATIALGLLIHTRQTYYVVAPAAFVLALARGGRDLRTSPRFWCAGLTVVAVLIARIGANASTGGLAQQMAGIFLQPVLAPTILRHHALFDVARFGVLPALTVAAIVWAWLGDGVARAAAIAFLLSFVVTYPCGMSSPGVEIAQRLSAVAFGALLVAIAGAAVLEARVPPSTRTAVGLGAAMALAALPPFFPAWQILRERTPVHREYLAVAAAAPALPPAFTLVKAPTAEVTVHGHARYAGLLERAGKRVTVVPSNEVASAPRPWIFLEDIECWTYSFRELTGAVDDRPTGVMLRYRWDKVLFGREPSPLRPVTALRPECGPLVRDGTPIGPRGVIHDPPDDAPFLFYGARSVPIQFYELR